MEILALLKGLLLWIKGGLGLDLWGWIKMLADWLRALNGVTLEPALYSVYKVIQNFFPNFFPKKPTPANRQTRRHFTEKTQEKEIKRQQAFIKKSVAFKAKLSFG